MNQPRLLPFLLSGDWCLVFLMLITFSPAWSVDSTPEEYALPDDLPSDASDMPAATPAEVNKDGEVIVPPQAPKVPEEAAEKESDSPAPEVTPTPSSEEGSTDLPSPANVTAPVDSPSSESEATATDEPSSVPFYDGDEPSEDSEPEVTVDVTPIPSEEQNPTDPTVPSDASDEQVVATPTDESDEFVSPGAPTTPQRERTYTTISGSKQFVVRGKDPSLNSALSVKCDDIRKGLLNLLKLSHDWQHAIDINVYGKSGSPTPLRPIRLGINIIEGEPHYYINLHIGRGIDMDNLYSAVTTMLLYERMLRQINPNGLPENIELPPWLLTGIEQAVQWKSEHADRNLYATLFERGEIFTPEQMLAAKNPQEEFDATTYAAYKASCGSLILCLLNQKGGEEAMLRVLNEAILGADQPENLIARNFPLLSLTPTSLHKWWSLQLSTMATPEMTEALTIAVSEKRLEEALAFLKYDQETRMSSTVNITDLDNLLALPDLNPQLEVSLNNLVYLSNRCFPTYRGIISGYARVIARLRSGKFDKASIKARLDELAELRRLSMVAATRTRDYLDWYEINSNRNPSNTFASYMRAMQILRMPNQSTSTPITRYLRDIEQLYLLPSKAPTPELSTEE